MLRTELLVAAVALTSLSAGCRRAASNPPPPSSTQEIDAGAADAASPSTDGEASCELVRDGFGPNGTVNVRAEKVATGLEVPWSLAFLPNGDVLVTERPGRIRLIHEGQLVEEPVANVPVTKTRGEGGLLGLTLAPDFEQSRAFYVYYTYAKGDGSEANRVERWKLAEDGRSATADRVILDDIPAARNHDGGRLLFGPDGMLYVGTGDAAKPDLSQDLDSLAGKILRITPDGEVPDDNPWPGKRAFIAGIRNTQGFAFRDATTLYVADHGPSGEFCRRAHDEVNVVEAGANLGWPTIYACETREGMVTPSITWATASPPGGLALYRGDAIPEWKDSVLVGVLGGRHLHRLVFDENEVAHHEVYFPGDPPDGLGRIRDVQVGPDGALWLTTSNCDGRGRCPDDKDWVVRVTK